MNRVTMGNIQIYSEIKQDKKLADKVYFTGADQRGNGVQLVSITAMGDAAQAIKNSCKRGDYINFEGRLNCYDINKYNISITYLEKSCIPNVKK